MRQSTVWPTEKVLVGEQAAFTASVSPEIVAVSTLTAKSVDIPAMAGGVATVVVVVGAAVVVVVGAAVVVVVGAGVRLVTSVIVYWLSNPLCADAPLTPSVAKPLTPNPSATVLMPIPLVNFLILYSFFSWLLSF
jgi:hypothetical protein